MWPHHIMVGVGETAISVGTDDTDLLARLEPWRIDASAELIDYGLALHPLAPDDAAARPLPFLRHGSCDIARDRDGEYLTEVLLRILGGFAEPTPSEHVRLALMPVVRNDAAILVPLKQAGLISRRVLRARQIEPIVTASSLVHLPTLTVLVDPPLGLDRTRRSVALHGWWFSTIHPDRAFTPANAVALAMANAEGKQPDTAERLLHELAQLVDRFPPGLAPMREADLVTALDDALP